MSTTIRKQFNKKPIWLPADNCTAKWREISSIIEKKYDLKFSDYWQFHKWTKENIAEFWAEIWDYFEIIYSKPYDQIVDLRIPMEDSPKWFEGARLNYAEHLLRYRDDHTALILAGENREVERLSYKEMYEETRMYAAAFRKMGLQKGDRVACYMSNRKEAVIALLAVTSIGAIWTAKLATLGAQAYLNGLKEVRPKVLLTIDQFPQNKETINLLKNIKDITEGLKSLEKVIIVPSRPDSKKIDISCIKNSCFLDDFLKTAYNADGTLPDMQFEQVSFSHPLFISYSSGTAEIHRIVHGFGTLLSFMRDYGIHLNASRKKTFLTASPAGWVTWNIMNHNLFFGSAVVLFEGVPFILTPTYLWDMVDNLKINLILIAPYILDAMEARNCLPTEKHSLSSLKSFMAVGGVVKHRNYDFVMTLKKSVRLEDLYGSVELMGCCALCEASLPIYEGEISSPCFGLSVECQDSEGNSLLGEMGECLITKPAPHLPLGFWEDPNGELYKKTYFSKHPGAFAMGDAMIINPVTKGIIICGRSDETLKQRGCRFGSSEIYHVVKMFPEIQDSLCVPQFTKDGDERAVLFILMKKGYSFNEEFVQKLRNHIAEELTVRHVPDVIIETPGIPYNAFGAKTEVIVKEIINKMPHKTESVVNPECLKFYYDVPELQGF